MIYDASNVPLSLSLKNNGDKVINVSQGYNFTLKLNPGDTVKKDVEDSEEFLQYLVLEQQVPELVIDDYQEISGLKVSVETGLFEGDEKVESGATVATITATGGTEPYSYSFNEDSVNGADNSKFVLEDNKVNVGDSALSDGTFKISVKVTDVNNETKTANAVIVVGIPEIDSVTVTPVDGLVIPVETSTKVADLATEGGVGPYTYSLKASTQDNDLFTIEGTTVKPKAQIAEPGEKNITVTVTDSNGKTKDGTATINIDSPEITDFTVDPEEGLTEGNSNVDPDAVVATLSAQGGSAPITYSLREDGVNGADNDSFVVDGTNLKVGESELTAKQYKVALKATDKYSKTKDANTTINVVAQEISALNADVTPGLTEGNNNVKSGATIATLSTVGGTAPYTYALNTDEVNGVDNASFAIAGDKLNVGSTALVTKNYKVSVKVTDKNGKTATKNITVTVTAPNISALNANITSGLLEGNPNVASGATVANLSTTGGIAPYTYALNTDASNGADNSSFVISGTKLNVGSSALVKKDYKVSLKVTDKNSKTATKNITISVGTPAITALNVEPVAELTAPIEAETVVANLSAQGGIAPYTYSLKGDTGDNAEFKIDGTTVKTVGSIDAEATKNITVVVTDKNGSTKEQSAEITIAGAGA